MLEVGHPRGTLLIGGERSHGGAHRRRAPQGRAASPALWRAALLADGQQVEAAARCPGELLAKGEQVGWLLALPLARRAPFVRR